MKASVKTLLTGAACFALIAPVQSQTTDLILGARPQGLGGAYTAIADDANAVYWNPAGLARVEHRDITFMHWLFADVSDVMVDYIAFAQPLGTGTLGLSWTRQGATLEEGADKSESTMSVNTFMVSYGMPIGEHVALGVTLDRTLVTSRAPTNGELAFDAGILYKPLDNTHWTIGFNAKNLGGEQVLPPFYVLGMAYKYEWKNQHILATADAHTQEGIEGREDFTFKYGGGAEYSVSMDDFSFALRAGGNSRTWAGGVGLGFKGFAIDYAYVSMREDTIGDSHKFGVSYRFQK
jgi:hypothetical protein